VTGIHLEVANEKEDGSAIHGAVFNSNCECFSVACRRPNCAALAQVPEQKMSARSPQK
jgi:hypothetical protein